MKTKLNFLDKSNKDYGVKQWEIIKDYSATVPYVKLCLEKELNDKVALLKKIFNKESTNNLSDNELKLIVDLCKYVGIKNHQGDFYTFGFLKKTSTDLGAVYSNLIKEWSKEFRKNGYLGNFENRSPAITDSEAEMIIKMLPPSESFLSNLTKVKKLNLKQMLEANDLLCFLENESQEKLEEVLDISSDIEDSTIFNTKKMEELGDCIIKAHKHDIFTFTAYENKHIALNALSKFERVAKFYYQDLPKIISKKVSDWDEKQTNSKKIDYKEPFPSFRFAKQLFIYWNYPALDLRIEESVYTYKLLEANKDDQKSISENSLFKYLKKLYVDTLSVYCKNHPDSILKYFSDLKNMLERMNTTDLDLNKDPNKIMNDFLNSLNKNEFVCERSLVNLKVDCNWLEWFNEILWCIKNKISALWNRSYNITNAVILKKTLNKFNTTEISIDPIPDKNGNGNTKLSLAEFLESINKQVPNQDNTSNVKETTERIS